MDDNKRGYDDFFRKHGESNDSVSPEAGKREVSESSEQRPSNYYSYGPYKSAMGQGNSEVQPAMPDSQQLEATQVEMTPPKPVRPYSYNGGQPPHDPMAGWQHSQQKKRGSVFKSGFISFLAGALLVGGLMYSSDKGNWFTGTEGVLGSNPSASSGAGQLAASNGSNGAVTPTAMDLGRPTNIAQIAEQSGPAVVKIETKVKATTGGRSGSVFDDPFFRHFFGDDPGARRPDGGDSSGQLQPGGMGTGFIFEKTGYILTNEHVIEGADEIWVTVEGYEKPFKAELLGHSYDLDLAALKIQGDKDFPFLPLGSPDNVAVGDWVVAIGNPHGFDHTVTVGVLSAKERPIAIPDSQGVREYKHLLQTDASINPGNSGGPLLNMNGEVIGINTAVSAQAQGIGFAIPTSTISGVLDNLKNNVEIPKEPAPYVGVKLADIDQDWLAELKLQSTDGAIVSEVERRSPAFKAGIRPYDVITAVNGAPVTNSAELVEKIKSLKVNDKADLTIMRDGKQETISVTIGDRNAEQ
ncbi:S1C family serine protease [Paenibacillus xerothermodurans]|uniref:PDZ domain-containing protein n=1 Tax=Paenibacillus xerothermodurans TaxID=1977292 RepID=A0A2W1NAV0_PAEXE|nr:trypsin-like peptidase domain-containing protein [Paenibacillus xerothermodurans]PZE20351.1 PDZ domain-containing protein [Paenibacillus xerothermodurans]